MTSPNNILFTLIANDMFNMMPIINLPKKNVKIILKALLFFHLNNVVFFLKNNVFTWITSRCFYLIFYSNKKGETGKSHKYL